MNMKIFNPYNKMDFDFNSYKKSIMSFKEDIDYILILKNDCICVGFTHYEINIYFPKDFTRKINIKYIANQEQFPDKKIFIMEKEVNQLLTLYNANILYVREIVYANRSYKDLKIIENFNFCYLRKSINENYFYGIGEKKIGYFRIYNQVISILKLNDFNVEFFYEIPSKKFKEIVVKNRKVSKLYFFDRIKFKTFAIIEDIRFNARRFTPIDTCPFIYYKKENMLGVFSNLIDFIDMKTHTIVYKYYNTSTSYPSIVYTHKLNNKKYFVVQYNTRAFIPEGTTAIYLANLEPKNINVFTFEKEIKKLAFYNQTNIIFFKFSPSMKYLVLRNCSKRNEIILFSRYY